MHIMYVGPVGTGKTFNAVAEALADRGDFIVTNMPIDADRVDDMLRSTSRRKLIDMFVRADGTVPDQIVEVLSRADADAAIQQAVADMDDEARHALHAKTVAGWQDFNEETAKNARCGVFLIDEAPLWLDARKYDALSPDARRKIIEHRKDDLLIVSTAQDVAFIDKVFRLLCDEIRLLRMSRLPFIGWIWPTCVRPTIICKDCGRVRRDGHGDDKGWAKFFGVGTIYSWTTFKAKDLIAAQDTSGESIEPKAIGSGWRLFDIRIASAYDTGAKLSSHAEEALRRRRAADRPAKRVGSGKAARVDNMGGLPLPPA